ncbi:hypothetical protein ACFX2I_046228 [Malus domestica]
MEVVNHSLGDLLRCLVGEHLKSWDQKLCIAEFAYNRSINHSTGMCHFYIMFGLNPRAPVDLAPIPNAKRISGKAKSFVDNVQQVHSMMHKHFQETSHKYKAHADSKRQMVEFDVGDFVWAILTNDHFSAGEYNKLSARKIGPYEILEKINPNAYCLKLPSHIRVQCETSHSLQMGQ